MDALRRCLLVVALIIVVSMTPIGLAVRAPAGQPSSAPAGPLQGTSTPPPAQGQQGSMVLLLFLPPESLARLRVGTPCLLQVALQAMRESAQPPEREGAFW